MKTLYLDCFSGISGDMTIAALLDLGASAEKLEAELRKLGLHREYHLRARHGKQQGISGVKFEVHVAEHDHHQSAGHSHSRTFTKIRRLIERSRLSSFVRNHAVSLFRRIAVAEGKIHGVPAEKVHFHEVGAIDSIVDIVGVCILLEKLSPQQVLASTPCEGHGFVECAHGRFPVPTPATLELLRGVPLQQIDLQGELITPTGAAILAEFVEKFGPMSAMTIHKIGYGLGNRCYENHPNALRALWGDAPRAAAPKDATTVDVIETNVDDASPEILAAAAEKLLTEGALDVFLTPILMKKGRLGTQITLLSRPEDCKRLSQQLLWETGSFGLRIHRSERICLTRETRRIRTSFGPVEIKIGSRDGTILSAKPEFESCRKLAARIKKPVRQVWSAAMMECSRLLNRP